MDEYNNLRECELESALAESKNDIKNNNYITGTIEEHLRRLEDA